ncbi:50S ribosomal protein L28 [Clostridium aestuarii]|uniref:Large ribosomal subunit protein bL28 n=1 Tax=Clostridium aestuarii TaxID=338193 RepID=A0ABT4CYC2_9CLOT|nr:50S ribosomal protein L28 [Clostridium aestuarii]MCY6483994.1 50S ribosomal protein L28 [Clostridium aestuarii]
MAKKCDICGKGVVSGVQYSHSHRQSKRKWAPNIKSIKALVNGSPRKINVCTRCLRSGKVQRAV